MSEEDKTEKATRSTSDWMCPECKRRLTLYVKPSAPPTCTNKEKHESKAVAMVPR